MTGWNLEHTYTQLPGLFYRHQPPASVPRPELVIYNRPLALSLGLSAEPGGMAADYLSGNKPPPDAVPISQAYAGHQFGHFAMLGDGRAVLLGEQVTPDGSRVDVQLKGSGRTPYSRRGDGLAALSPMLREYIISQAMHGLGIPTTRSLAVTLTGAPVVRDKVLPGAVLARTASSHIRVGTFSYAAAFGGLDDIRALADYSIRRHFPEIGDQDGRYFLFFKEAARRQASLIARWQLAGFVHGVMNTDNMAVSGETIDYGPCAFLDAYDPDTVFSSIDVTGRYAYKNQPPIGAWNLSRLAEALLPLFGGTCEMAQEGIAAYWDAYQDAWLAGMRDKLGLYGAEPGDAGLAGELLDIMAHNKLDYTGTFRTLSTAPPDTPPVQGIPAFDRWHEQWQARLARQPQDLLCAAESMRACNPAVIPRNHRVEEALSAVEDGDYSVMENLLEAVTKPYHDSERYAHPPALPSCGYKTFCGT